MAIAGASRNLLEMLGTLTPMRIIKWAPSSSVHEQETEDDRTPAEFFQGANVVTSKRKAPPYSTPRHAVLLDLDVPAYLIPSSTPGHSHLYIDVDCGQADYFAFLDAAAKIGVIEEGYAKASKRKGATYLRLPWVHKIKGWGPFN